MPDIAELAGNALCVGLPGDRLDEATRATLLDLRPCGIVLFARNVSTLAATRAFVAEVNAVFASVGRTEPLMCVDQEGGRVARLRFTDALPSMLTLGAANDMTLAERAGVRIGRDLAMIGANLDFAPVLDLALAPKATAIGTRSFGDDPERVARLGAALIRGIQRTGVAATAKHFPGHGDSPLDPHVDFPTRAAVQNSDLVPFAAAIAAGILALMCSHLVVSEHGLEPATVTPAILYDLLRLQLGFTGVAFTDCLQMDAIARGMGSVSGAIMALRAGADALVVSNGLEEARAIRDAIVAAVEAGKLDPARLEDATRRTQALRVRLARQREQRDAIAAEDSDPAIAGTIARAGLVRVRGNVRISPGHPITVVSFEGDASDGIARDHGERPSLSLALRRRRERSELFRVALAPDEAMGELLVDVLDAQRADTERTVVVLARRAHLFPEQQALLARLFDRAPGAIAVSALEPFDLPYLRGAANVVATGGDEAPSIEALADLLTGRCEAHGTLPITLGGPFVPR